MTDDPLPLTFDPVSNGEYAPPPKTARDREAERRVYRRVERAARRLGISRRAFLAGPCGMAAALLTVNEVYGSAGGGYAIRPEMLLEPQAASGALEGKEFIFDVQSHHVMPDGPWRQNNPLLAMVLRGWGRGRGEKDPLRGLSRYYYAKEIFLDSDTTVAVLSALPALPEGQPLPDRDAAETREIVDRLGKSPRLLVHGLVTPNVEPLSAQLEGMERLASEFKIAAWKVYTPWGPRGQGWWLDDEKVGIPFLEKARALGIRIVCAHKGLPLGFLGGRYDRPVDVGRVARRFPDLKFVIYHSGYDPAVEEGPYDPGKSEAGVNCLVRSLEENGIAPGSNVYAELGSTWWLLMKRPEQAAHVLGKLLKYVGPANVLWGTDSIWYGSPQPQIQAFRAFRIAPELCEKHGYPELTADLKARIFGLNAAALYGIDPRAIRQALPKDEIEKLRQAYLERPERSFAVYGPRTRREFFALLASRGGRPA